MVATYPKGKSKVPSPGNLGKGVRDESIKGIQRKATMGMEPEERMEETLGNYYAKDKDSRMEEKREKMMGVSIMVGMACGGKVKK